MVDERLKICLASFQFFAIFFDAKKTAAKETAAVENFINLHHRAGNDFKLITDFQSVLQTLNPSYPLLWFDFTDKISQGDKQK